jgi:hypothetical protein
MLVCLVALRTQADCSRGSAEKLRLKGTLRSASRRVSGYAKVRRFEGC